MRQIYAYFVQVAARRIAMYPGSIHAPPRRVSAQRHTPYSCVRLALVRVRGLACCRGRAVESICRIFCDQNARWRGRGRGAAAPSSALATPRGLPGVDAVDPKHADCTVGCRRRRVSSAFARARLDFCRIFYRIQWDPRRFVFYTRCASAAWGGAAICV